MISPMPTGELLAPGDPGYDRARRVFNSMIDKRPAWIVRCYTGSDVMHGLGFARERGMAVSVRGGGHSIGGKAVCDGGVMLDLSPMKRVHIDPQLRIADAEPGLTLAELDAETHAFGLATPLGTVSNTGIAGLTLGGGIGWLNGKYGLACDNLVSADIVTADGRLQTASETENEELFWAIRGGSGNFGVATRFRYRLHPVQMVLGGMVIHPIGRGRDLLKFYGEFAESAPDELSLAAALLTGPDGSAVVAVAG